MKCLHRLPFFLSSLMLLCLPMSPASALSTDRDQPAEIEADDIEFDFKKGTRTYIHNVLVVQGTLRLKADKVVANYKDNELDNATAWGSLARFKQRPDGKQQDIEGWAREIVINQKQNTLTLIGKAALKQGSDTARGEKIIYNMATDTLKVQGGAKLGTVGKAGQTVPKRTLEDPFKDNSQDLGEVAQDKPGNDPSSSSDAAADNLDAATKSTANESSAEETETQPAPTRSGRSRLIIQPK